MIPQVGQLGTRKESVIKANVAFAYGRNLQETQHDPDKRSFVKSTKRETNLIDSFTDEFDFLSPTYHCNVQFQGVLFPSYQHALEGSKCKGDKNLMVEITGIKNIKQVRKHIQHIDTNEWKDSCERYAEIILRDKFFRNKELRARLMRTSGTSIVYKNTYGDTTWGVSVETNKGSNRLGKLVEKIRTEIKEGTDLDAWLRDHVCLADKDDVTIEVLVSKEGTLVDTIVLDGVNTVSFGKQESGNDVVCAHASVSKYHCIVVADTTQGACLIDLGSANGTAVDGVTAMPFACTPILHDSVITLAASTRCYSAQVRTDKQARQKQSLYEKMADPNVLAVDPAATTVYVGNLPYTLKESEVRELFEPCGTISSVKLPRQTTDSSAEASGECKGFCFVVFTNEAALVKALRIDGDELQGRAIRVRRSTDEVARGGGTKRAAAAIEADSSGHYGPTATSKRGKLP